MQIQNNGCDWGVSHKCEVCNTTQCDRKSPGRETWVEQKLRDKTRSYKGAILSLSSARQTQTSPQTIFQDEPLSSLYSPVGYLWEVVGSFEPELWDFHQLVHCRAAASVWGGWGSGSSRLDLDPWSTYVFHLHRLAAIRPYLFTVLQSTSGRYGEVKGIWRKATICSTSHLRREGQFPSTCPVLGPSLSPDHRYMMWANVLMGGKWSKCWMQNTEAENPGSWQFLVFSV